MENLSLNSQSKELKPASGSKRFLNYILDSIAILVGLVFIYLFGANEFSNVNHYVFGLIIVAVYYLTFESIWARSPAKFITGTKVVNLEGRKPNFGQILVRTLSRFIPFDGFTFLLNPVGWHDELSGTLVVSNKMPRTKGSTLVVEKQPFEQEAEKIETEPTQPTEKPIYSSIEENTAKQIEPHKRKGGRFFKAPAVLISLTILAVVGFGFYWLAIRPVEVMKACTEQAQSRQDSHIEGNKPSAYHDYVVNNLHYSEAQITDLDSKIATYEIKSKESWMDAVDWSYSFRDPNSPDLAYLSDLKSNVPQRTVYKPASKEDKNTFYRECLSKGGLKPESLYVN